MFSQRFYNGLQKTYPLIISLGLSRYSWNPSKKLFHPLPKAKKLFRFNIIFLGVFIVFYLFQLTRYTMLKDQKAVTRLIAFGMGPLLALICFWLTLVSSKEFYVAVNSTLQFLRLLNGNIYSNS